jgi:hypothetical protein
MTLLVQYKCTNISKEPVAPVFYSGNGCCKYLRYYRVLSGKQFVELAAAEKQGSPHHWQFSKAHTGPQVS